MRDPRLPPADALAVPAATSHRRAHAAYPTPPSLSTRVSPPAGTSSPFAHLDSHRGPHHFLEPFSSRSYTSSQPLSSHPRSQFQQPSPSPPQYHSLAPADLPAPRTAPPAPVHRVYVLNCATCDNFLTDRGMRAVLLLKPHIVLFSTDAAPCNAETAWPDEGSEEEHVERTCDCLTSSIACHGCGRTVGYHIVAPCTKCTDSVQKHQRSANHHRFVFHHNEVVWRERTYYPSERGVLNPIIPSSIAPRAREPTPPPAPVVTRRRTSIWDTEKDSQLLEARLAPQVPFPHSPPTAQRRRSPSPGRPHHSASGAPQAVQLLQAGDTLYWHHLVSGGERSKPVDPRFRQPIWTECIGR